MPGLKIVGELSQKIPCDLLFITEKIHTSFPYKECFLITHEMMKKLTSLPSPEPVAAVFPMPQPSDLSGKKPLLVLDGVSDPGNVGTLMRTALALGFKGVFLLEETADPYHDRAIRASKGAVFWLPIKLGSSEEFCNFARQLHVIIADIKGPKFEKTKVDALVLGSESHGPSKTLLQHFPTASIPMPGEMESLNVAAAGAIFMYLLSL